MSRLDIVLPIIYKIQRIAPILFVHRGFCGRDAAVANKRRTRVSFRYFLSENKKKERITSSCVQTETKHVCYASRKDALNALTRDIWSTTMTTERCKGTRVSLDFLRS